MTEKENLEIENNFKKQKEKITNDFIFAKKPEKTENKELEELNELFDKIILEIEERESFIKTLDEATMEDLILNTKQEIFDRIKELKQITLLMKQIKKNE